MMKTMKQILSNTLVFGHALFLMVIFSSCQSNGDTRPFYQLKINDSDTIEVRLAISFEDQKQGLSGVKPEELKDHQGMVFVYPKSGPRQFWMPDTYMDLDLFYLSKDLRVIEIVRNLKHHPGREEPIPRAPLVHAQHVLELKSSSPFAKKIRQFQKLNWTPGQTLPKILQDTRP